MIKIDGVSFSYSADDEKERKTLTDINLEIKKGEFIVLLGHNGSGKTTLAKLINGLLLPTSGRVWVNDLDTLDKSSDTLWKIRQLVGMVFQNPDNQIVSTVVEEDIAFGPENIGLPSAEIRKRVDEALRILRLEKEKQAIISQLSGGQKQRVAIAGIIAMRPDYIIFDEPTAMLDPQGQKEVMEAIYRLQREEGLTIILITHNMEEALSADRLVLLKSGQISLIGSPREIFKETEELAKMNLEPPLVVDLVNRLRRRQLDIKSQLITVDEMIDYLCTSKLKN